MRFASYPQILVFELEEFCHIKQLQILSHQYAIANKIDVYLAEGQSGVNEWKSLSWNRIGYLSLDKNERSSFRSRELKSVYLDHRARYVKLSLRESHVKHINVFNQVYYMTLRWRFTFEVGIVAFNVLADVVSKDVISLYSHSTKSWFWVNRWFGKRYGVWRQNFGIPSRTSSHQKAGSRRYFSVSLSVRCVRGTS